MKLNKIFLATVLGLTTSAVSAYSQQRKQDQYKGELREVRVERPVIRVVPVVVTPVRRDEKPEIRREEREEKHEIRREEHEIRREEHHEVNVITTPNSVSGNHIRSSGSGSYSAPFNQDQQAMADHAAPVGVEVTNTRHITKFVAPVATEAPTQRDIEVTTYNGAAEIERQQRLSRMEKDFGPVKP